MQKRNILKNKLYLYLTEFFAGMSVMAVELGASRLLAPYFSSSQIVYHENVIIRVKKGAKKKAVHWCGKKYMQILIRQILIRVAILRRLRGLQWKLRNPKPQAV